MAILLQRVADVSVSEIAGRATVLDAAAAVACVYDFDNHPYFVWMRDAATTLEEFRATQAPYRHFVEHFSRAIAAVLARVPSMERRLATVYSNVAEEHGHGALSESHRNTFIGYLKAIGVGDAELSRECPIRVAVAFEALLGYCLTNAAESSAAAMGIVEYTHIKISTMLAQNMQDRFWGDVEAQHHYRLHAEIDADHALDLFALCEEGWRHEPARRRIAYAMLLGAQIWWTLFDSMCPADAIAVSAADGIQGLLEAGSARADHVPVRRPCPRFRCDLPVIVQRAGAPALSARATAISVRGALVEGSAPAEVDAEVDLVITFPGSQRSVAVGGRVRFTTIEGESWQIGVEFAFASGAERAAIVDAVRAFDRGSIDPPPPARATRRPPGAGPNGQSSERAAGAAEGADHPD